ncbi:NADH-ubiquinone oxidoreductase-F iron-sulfur binding region domain-containing protein [Streptomyces himalayensis]|uniref:SLBB domain-containing protein n=1 Tax=Streptomyces himalayensis subsp. himalayensis TaxID=2756131 RepID=A0A7W0I788_9ACTN|nr:NADH-ubiquinone oxidoreductase-F iron-sulfur binding region domain-containing protein [Streptomyces himalayensis]MBA2945050.1 SLBB domain-containing protein [Streptomyces himalayensis subsp. himalayensis]
MTLTTTTALDTSLALDTSRALAATAGHAPGIEPRLAVDRPLDLAAERERGTYGLPTCPDVIAELEAAGLRGRGGAGFPAHIKWRGVAEADGLRVVVANGEEGEPSSYKDRWLLTYRPHLVLDGLLLAARTVGADRAVVYLSHPETETAVRAAIAELDSAAPATPAAGVRLDVHVVEPTYVAGDETAVCRSISGGPALPTARPPRVGEKGVDGLPTLVSNVETLAHAAWIARNGAAAYRDHGTAESPGTTLVTLSGACGRPGVYEVPYGLTVAELFEIAGGFTSRPAGFLMGGWFGGLLGPAHAETVCTYEDVRAAGSGLGCGAITALHADQDPLAVAAEVSAWYAAESAQQCGVCVKGTASIRDAFASLDAGTATAKDRDNLARWGQTLPGRGACAFLDGAATWARTVLTEFPEHIGADGTANADDSGN